MSRRTGGVPFRVLLLTLAGLLSAGVSAHAQGRTHAVILVGLGGSEEFRTGFHAEASQIYDALIDTHGLDPDDVAYFGERVETAPEMIRDRSTRANVLQYFGELAQRARGD